MLFQGSLLCMSVHNRGHSKTAVILYRKKEECFFLLLIATILETSAPVGNMTEMYVSGSQSGLRIPVSCLVKNVILIK